MEAASAAAVLEEEASEAVAPEADSNHNQLYYTTMYNNTFGLSGINVVAFRLIFLLVEHDPVASLQVYLDGTHLLGDILRHAFTCPSGFHSIV